MAWFQVRNLFMILPSIWGGDSAFLPLPIKFGIEISAVCWSDLGVGRISGDPSDSSFPGMEVRSGFAEIDCTGLPEVNLKLAFFFSSSAFFRNVSTANASWCAIYQDDGVSTTPPGFFDVATWERAFGVPPDLSMDEGPAVEEIAQIFSVHGCNSGLQPCSFAHFAVELNLFRCRVASETN